MGDPLEVTVCAFSPSRAAVRSTAWAVVLEGHGEPALSFPCPILSGVPPGTVGSFAGMFLAASLAGKNERA